MLLKLFTRFLVNLKIEKSLARTSELLVKLSPKGKSRNLFVQCVWDVKAVLGERKRSAGKEGGAGRKEMP